MIDQQTLWQRYSALPLEAQNRVVALVEWLTLRSVEPIPPSDDAPAIIEDPAFGMWRDRAEMSDSSAWIRETRKSEWENRHG